MFFKKKYHAEEKTLTSRFRIRETLFGKIILQVRTLGGTWRDATMEDWMLISAVECTQAALEVTRQFQSMFNDHMDRSNPDDFKDTYPMGMPTESKEHQRLEPREGWGIHGPIICRDKDGNVVPTATVETSPGKVEAVYAPPTMVAGDSADKAWERLLTPKERTKLAEVRERYNPDLTVQQFIEAQKYLAECDRKADAEKKAGRPGWTQLNGRG